MNFSRIDQVRPLRFVENQFLQVLITRFSLKRRGEGAQLRIGFDDDAPTITTRLSKTKVRGLMPRFSAKSLAYQQKLDSFLVNNEVEAYEHDDDDFPFRYASGGTLPVLRTNGTDYYCLFYRDIFPIGWNIANGGCYTREELLNPITAAERELREELVIVDPYKGIRFVLMGSDGTLHSDPRRVAGHRAWIEIFPQLARSSFKEAEVPLKWMEGPDSVKIQIEGYDFSETSGCFLNINAADFGIEVDKVVKIGINSDVVLCDGEQTGNWIVNRLVGLFNVDRMDSLLASGSTEFHPDRVFFNARVQEERSVEALVERELIPHLRVIRSREEQREFAECASKYDLCPVTRNILRRYGQRVGEDAQKPSHVEVFISYGGEDESWARKVNEFLRPTTKTFFFKEHDYRDTLSRTIDNALDSANCLILVGTSLENIKRDRCAYEWRRFYQDIQYQLKSPRSNIVPFISGINPEDLPRELRDRRAVLFRPASFELDLEELSRNVPRELRRSANAVES